MKIIISPSKTMFESINNQNGSTPYFISDSIKILNVLKNLSVNDIENKFKLNKDKSNELYNHFQTINLKDNLGLALTLFNGQVFKKLDYQTLDINEINYLEKNLYILSALYGALKPNDLINTYRLDFENKIYVNNLSLYNFWNNKVYKYIKDDVIINLASNEYSNLISPYIDSNVLFLTIHFKEYKNDKLISKSTESKIMRGIFLRYMAINDIRDYNILKKFNLNNYKFDKKSSDINNYVFVKKEI